MQMLSEDRASAIIFAVDEVERDHYPSVNLVVEVIDRAFRGSVAAWIEMDALQAFVEHLRECERTRRGSATLVGMSPDALEMRVEQSDALGHFVARYKLTAPDATRPGIPQTLAGGFPLDSEQFAGLVADFAHLAAVCGPA